MRRMQCHQGEASGEHSADDALGPGIVHLAAALVRPPDDHVGTIESRFIETLFG